MNKFDALVNALRSDGSIIINKTLSKRIGLHEAIVYSELLSKYNYFKKNDQLINLKVSTDKKTKEITYSKELYFFCTVDDLEESTTLSKDQQEKPIKKLISLKLIDKKVKQNHLGKKVRYFTINENIDLILSFMNDDNKKPKEMPVKYVSSFDSQVKEENPLFQTSKIHLPKQGKSDINNTNINNTNLINKDDDKKDEIIINQDQIDLVVQEFNNVSNKTMKYLTEKRKANLQAILDKFGVDKVKDAINKIKNSEWAINNLDFSHMFSNDDNFTDVLNGKYDTYKSSTKSKSDKFTTTHTHSWNMDELEERNQEYLQTNIKDYPNLFNPDGTNRLPKFNK